MLNVIPELNPLIEDRFNDLGPGKPNLAAKAEILQAAQLLTERAANGEFAQACIAGLWLLHDFLDESHRVSQDLDTAEGSYWHAIMHRREPDPSNSKYWFRRVGSHPVVSQLAEQAALLKLEYQTPVDFVDTCESVRDSHSPGEELAKRVQQLEWQLLFAYCYDRARMPKATS
jgi:hypothetical protein